MNGFYGGKEVFLTPEEKNLKAEDIEKMFSPLGFFILRLDGASVADKRELLAALAEGLRFPGYFGHNWDALLDCLRSLPDFITAQGYAVIIERSALFLKDSPEDMEDFRDIAGTAAEFLLEKYKVPFKIVML